MMKNYIKFRKLWIRINKMEKFKITLDILHKTKVNKMNYQKIIH